MTALRSVSRRVVTSPDPIGSCVLREAKHRRNAGRVAAALFSAGALSALLTAQFLKRPSPPLAFYGVIVLAILTGIACMLIPWERLSLRWLHGVSILGTIETSLAVGLAGAHGGVYSVYYVFVVALVAYSFASRQAIAAHVVLATAALIVMFSRLPAANGERIATEVLGIAALVVIATVVTALREALESRQRELELLAVRDPLTGVGNYRLLAERLDREIAWQQASGEPLTVMLLDLDGFKGINDGFGHLVGDEILRAVAHALESTVRSRDTLARQGGDEFAILAHDTNREQASVLAERVRDAVAEVTNNALSISAGWVTFPSDAGDPSTLLALADAELRANKARAGSVRGAPLRSELLALVAQFAA
jgi:diguanylate cyclase (GGDEF)-like protein